jgi:hypothetical protein
MQTLDSKTGREWMNRRQALRGLVLAGFGIALSGCRKTVAEDASDSDANGYYCVGCNAKLYTARNVFIGPKCPKCSQDTLMEAVGYVCEKDQHLTIRPRVGDRAGSPVCDKCKSPVSAMRLPREKDLKDWGATKVEG